jgi:hypothetical protein
MERAHRVICYLLARFGAEQPVADLGRTIATVSYWESGEIRIGKGTDVTKGKRYICAACIIVFWVDLFGLSF